jgi:UDP-N-acetylglucosamine 2-epimerase (non-hydrolysing)
MYRGLFILGTRPEAIKLFPLVFALRNRPGWDARVCATGQHRELFDRVLEIFDIQPDWNLRVMTEGGSLAATTAKTIEGLEPVIEECRPDVVFVQGDTLSTVCGALVAFYARVPVVHVEAGLRTGNAAEPFPEEMNRLLTGRIASLHCAATQEAADNLIRENTARNSVILTGNTGIDALYHVVDGIRSGRIPTQSAALRDPARRLILVTAHRRESFGEGMRDICRAIRTLSTRPDVHIVFPVHPNPSVRETVYEVLGKSDVQLTEPLDYPEFVDLLSQAYLVITDSGGIQEEAPSLGKPVLVLRNRTERPESVATGTSLLVGTSPEAITGAATRLLDDEDAYESMARVSAVYGDGKASERILDAVERLLAVAGEQHHLEGVQDDVEVQRW